MEKKTRISPILKTLGFLFLLIGLPIIWIIINKTGIHYSSKLPILFERELNAKGDTIFHTIDNFKLVNQNGDSVSLKNFDNKLLLVNFFFSNCESVCPKLSYFIAHNIYREYEKDSSVRFISITVDPDNDSVSVLKKYADQYKASYPQWQFLTGSKKKIYDLALNSFKIPGADDEHQGLFHSNQMVLVDKELRVRGVFNTDYVDKLNKEMPEKVIIDAVRALKLEYKK